MDSGTYFELRESSDLLKGQILFSYTGIKSDQKPVYPFFLVFNKEKIDFYFYGLINKKQTKDNKEEIIYPEFIETLLFSLNLHKGKENISKLNNSLRDLFDKKFPVVEDFIIYNGSGTINSHEKHKTYAELKQLPPLDKKSEKGSFGEKLPYRVLLLDFLFDVYHADVFDNCPGFILIKQHLDEIPFIQAIKRKAEFYYQVENNKSDEKLVTFDSTNSNYIDKLIKAQEEWLDILQEEDSNKFINRDNIWFVDVETEVKKVIKKQVIKKVANEENSVKRLIDQKLAASQWFIKRNNFVEAWKSAFDIFYWRMDFVKWFGILIALALLLEIINIIFNIEDATFIPCDIKKNFLLVLLATIIIIFTIIYLFIIFSKKPNTSSSRLKHLVFVLFRFSLVPFLILLLTSAFATSELTAFANKYLIINDISYKGYLYFLFLFLFTFGIILIYFVYNVARSFRFDFNKKILLSNLLGILIVAFVLDFHYNIFLKYNKVACTLHNLFKDTGNIFPPNPIDKSIWYILVFTLVLVIVIFWILLNDERKSHPNLYVFTSLKKVLSMLLVGMIFSFFCNLLVLNYMYKDYLDKFSFVDEVWNSAFHPNENAFKNFSFDTKKVINKKKILNILNTPESSQVSAEKEEYYYSSLENLIITKNGKELYPIVKKLNIHGFEIITLPAVLYINTFLTLLLAVLIQVVLNHKKFLEGGKA